jgi:hypothetical protein
MQGFVRLVFRGVRWVSNNPDEIEYQLLNFNVGMIFVLIMMGALFTLRGFGLI